MVELKESRYDGLIGIWWYTPDNRVIAFTKFLNDAVRDGDYYQYSLNQNHLTLWKEAIKKISNDPDIQSQLHLDGYKSIERGRVIYDTRTQAYIVTCSKQLISNGKFRRNIINSFNLDSDRVDFKVLNHYYIKKNTGNPFLDGYNEV